jgi:diguanylate cyclase (GGDEF)-like protein
MLLDLDNFKSINHRFGHAIGDRVLGIFAEVASGCLRRIDLFGRLGGEEFAAVLFDTTSERALAVGEEIRTEFAGGSPNSSQALVPTYFSPSDTLKSLAE